MQATNTFQVVVLNCQRCSTPTLSALNINSRNSSPCIGPIVFTHAGLLYRYFAGTAIPINTNSEIPSRRPRMRRRPVFVFNNCFMAIVF